MDTSSTERNTIRNRSKISGSGKGKGTGVGVGIGPTLLPVTARVNAKRKTCKEKKYL
jgi:hypothetical protein